MKRRIRRSGPLTGWISTGRSVYGPVASASWFGGAGTMPRSIDLIQRWAYRPVSIGSLVDAQKGLVPPNAEYVVVCAEIHERRVVLALDKSNPFGCGSPEVT